MAFTQTPPKAAPVSPLTRMGLRRAITAAAIGNFITWFDFAAYGFLAVLLAKIFFPLADPLTSLLSTFATFGVAFLMNPVGGMFFGRLGDKIGRKRILATVITLMSLSTFAVGLLPGYNAIGLAAPALLVLLRIIQGFAAGGEPGGAATFLVESAKPGTEAVTVSFWHCSSYLANAAASALILGLHAVLTSSQMLEWGWRIPFLIAGPLGMVALYIRLRISDTAEFERLQQGGETSQNPIRDAVRGSWRQILQTIGCIALQAAAFYFIFVYMETYLQSERGFTSLQASVSTVICLAAAGITIFLFARIADRRGRKPVMIAGAALLAAFAYPVFVVLGLGIYPLAVAGHTLLGICLALFMAGSGAGLVEIFPSRIRYTGFSIGFNISVALFGGTAPYIATALIAGTGSALSPALIVIATGAVAVVAALFIKEPRLFRSSRGGTDTALQPAKQDLQPAPDR